MRIVVCIKQVPLGNELELDPDTGNLKRQTGEKRMNPCDRKALRAALEIKDALALETEVQIAALSMGPASAGEVLREALAMGADEGVILSDSAFSGADVLATARTLSAGIRASGGADLVIFGSQTTDGDTGQVGPETAVFLDFPCVYGATDIRLEDKTLLYERKLSACIQYGSVMLPAAVCVDPKQYQERAVSLKQKIQAKKKTIPVFTQKELALPEPGLSGSATRVVRVYASERMYRGKQFSGDLQQFSAYLQREMDEVLEEKRD